MKSFRLSLLGGLRRWSHPFLLLYWSRRQSYPTTTHVAGLRLHVDPTVFHPKFFGSSKALVEFVAGLNLKGLRFLDMGTGTGVVGLHASRAGARVTAVDINPVAVGCARSNAEANGIEMDVVESDLFEAVGEGRFDVVAWNPPFFKGDPAGLAECAWFAGPQYETIARFAGDLEANLNKGGRAYLVFSLDLDVGAIGSLFEACGFKFSCVATRRWVLGETMAVYEVR